MKNNMPACTTNQRGYSDGEFGTIVNPHDITGSHSLEKGTEDATYHPAMKQPRQALKVPSEVPIEQHARQHVNRLLCEVPGVIRTGTNNYSVRCVAEDVPGPARDCTPGAFRKRLRFSKKMISDLGHPNSE
jgi:hypothetical protein